MASDPICGGSDVPLPIRVVHVLHSFGTGGLEKGVATLVRNASPDIEHVVACLTESGASERLLPPGTRVMPLGKRPGNSPVFVWRLSRVLRRLRPCLVHTRNWGGMDAVVAARLAGIRAVIHGEHGWGMDDPDGLNPRRVRVRRALARWPREYTAVSRAIEHWLEETIRVGRPVTQIYNGVDVALFQPGRRSEVRERLGFPRGAFLVGIVGRLDPIKDHRTLFAAFAEVRNRVPGAVLLVVGDGPERTRLQSVAGEGVEFLGDRPDVHQILNALDVFALSSRNEGISNTILEAMATGLPVVATRVGGNPELVQDGVTGALIAPGSAGSLAEALLGYAASSERRTAHGRSGRERVQRAFSVPRMVGDYEEVYRRVWGRWAHTSPRRARDELESTSGDDVRGGVDARGHDGCQFPRGPWVTQRFPRCHVSATPVHAAFPTLLK